MPLHTEGFLDSDDGLKLYRQAWLPDDPVAVVMIFHGLGEHSGRYEHVANALNDAGYAVHAVDHRGHGKSDGKRVFVKRYDEFMDDLEIFRSFVEAEHPGLPLVALGHSMGGNLAVGHTLRHQDGLTALALSAPALEVGSDISPTQLKIFGLLGRFTPSVRPQGLDATAISRDPAVVQAYIDDPLVFTGKMTAGIGWALIDQMAEFPARYPEFRLPILLVHGTADQLAGVGGSRALEAGAVNADVTAHYYEGLYHEVFNEPEQDQVIGDLVSWLGSVVG